MKLNHHYHLHLSYTLLFLIHFATPYELPTNYFINCGSDSSINLLGQTYSSDTATTTNSASFSFSPSKTSALQTNNPSSSIHPLYQTARIHTHSLSYNFPIDQNSTYLLIRLHFHSFSSAPPQSINLSNAIFDVSISGTPLLSNFSTSNNASMPVIHEFIIPVHESLHSMLQIDFTPRGLSSLAFINAIEAFTAPDNLISKNELHYPHVVTKQGHGNANTLYHNLHLKMLHNIYRINMGGGNLTPENDTLNRYWTADDDYLLIPLAAKNSLFRSQKPGWNFTLSDQYIAPDLVYQTSKELNVSSSRLANSFNLTWKFNVAKKGKHLVRAHFCNIIGDIMFNFFLNGYYGLKVLPCEFGYLLGVPFYIDFVVDSDESGVLNISVGHREDSRKKTAFLNGLEIMELMDAPMFGNVGESGSRKKTLLVTVGSVVGSFVLMVVLFLALFFGIYRRKMVQKCVRSWPENDESACIGLVEASTSASPLSNFNLGLKISIVEIISATNNFDACLMIGEGGFGKVYRGSLQDGTEVAVKRSQPGHGQGLPEFQTEIIILSKIRHVHLVSLIGYCDEMSEMILVYEFMEKGTLREHLYGDSEKNSNTSRTYLSWENRLKICIGSARGLHYLHAGAVNGIIHRDVKSTNILLDKNYLAKVADFGLSSVLLDQSHVTTGIKGSFGYLDPEYFRTLQLTEKSDVYSFGVVLLEVLCARPAIKNSQRREEINLAEWGMLWHEKGQLQEIIDTFLIGKINPISLRVFGEAAAKCLQGEGVNRPTMGEVIWELEYSLQLQNIGGASREVNEYSTTDGSSMYLQMMMVQRLPSYSLKVDEDESMAFNDSEETSASDIFSQLRIEEAR